MMRNWKLLTRIWTITAMACVGTVAMSTLAPVSAAPGQAGDGGGGTTRNVAKSFVNVADSPSLAGFAKWLEQYSSASAGQKTRMEAEGVRLAQERRPVLGALIVQNPSEAMKYAVMPAQRQKLPPAVVAELEQFVEGDAYYDLSVSAAIVDMPVPHRTGETQKVVRETLTVIFKVGEQGYRPHFYGKRGALVSMDKVPFYGVAVGQDLVVHESPLRLLEEGESIPLYAYPGKNLTVCPICKKDASKGLVAVSGTTIYYFDEMSHADEFREKLWRADNKTWAVE